MARIRQQGSTMVGAASGGPRGGLQGTAKQQGGRWRRRTRQRRNHLQQRSKGQLPGWIALVASEPARRRAQIVVSLQEKLCPQVGRPATVDLLSCDRPQAGATPSTMTRNVKNSGILLACWRRRDA